MGPHGLLPSLFCLRICNTHLLYTFSKLYRALFRAQGLLPAIFEFPFSRCVSLYVSHSFDLFRTSFFTVLNLLMIIEPPDDRRSTSRSARLYQHCAIKYTNLHGGTYSPRKYFQHTSPILFFKTFVGPRGYCPLFSNSLLPLRIPRFFRRFDIFSHFLLHGSEPPDDYWTS